MQIGRNKGDHMGVKNPWFVLKSLCHQVLGVNYLEPMHSEMEMIGWKSEVWGGRLWLRNCEMMGRNRSWLDSQPKAGGLTWRLNLCQEFCDVEGIFIKVTSSTKPYHWHGRPFLARRRVSPSHSQAGLLWPLPGLPKNWNSITWRHETRGVVVSRGL